MVRKKDSPVSSDTSNTLAESIDINDEQGNFSEHDSDIFTKDKQPSDPPCEIEKPVSTTTADRDLRGRPCFDIAHKSFLPSALSHRNKHSDLRGFLNLLLLIVIAQNARLVIENLMKYGKSTTFNFIVLVSVLTSKIALLSLQAFLSNQ